MPPYYLGIDLGTSGTRACVIDCAGNSRCFVRDTAVKSHSQTLGQHEQSPEAWWSSVKILMNKIPTDIRNKVGRIAVDGTSGTLLLCDDRGKPTSPALMYNDNRADKEARQIHSLAPATTGAQGTGSSLAKLLWLQNHGFDGMHALHQADWIAGHFTGNWNRSDSNNALKLGYDPVRDQWPDWMKPLPGIEQKLPTVNIPGSPIGKIVAEISEQLGFGFDVEICAGTTDSTAGFIATGANQIGDAVTTLGSTLVVKVLCEQPVFAPEYGIYSHRLQDKWLVGGASNTGGAVLSQYFTQQEMNKLTPQLRPDQPTGLDYYPLPVTGERFPINDPDKTSHITRQENRVIFFQGLLEGIAKIEKLAYEKLTELGCPYPSRVLTTGGGANNPAWRAIRESMLGCPVNIAPETEAAYGAAMLAKGLDSEQNNRTS